MGHLWPILVGTPKTPKNAQFLTKSDHSPGTGQTCAEHVVPRPFLTPFGRPTPNLAKMTKMTHFWPGPDSGKIDQFWPILSPKSVLADFDGIKIPNFYKICKNYKVPTKSARTWPGSAQAKALEPSSWPQISGITKIDNVDFWKSWIFSPGPGLQSLCLRCLSLGPGSDHHPWPK